jgi:Zn-dependent protease
MSNSDNESSPTNAEDPNPSGPATPGSQSGHDQRVEPGTDGPSPVASPEGADIIQDVPDLPAFVRNVSVAQIVEDERYRVESRNQFLRRFFANWQIEQKRRHVRRAIRLFVLTLLSTFLVGSGFFPLHWLMAQFSPRYHEFLEATESGGWNPFVARPSINELAWEAAQDGLAYALPLMLILSAHEMGHYLMARRNRVPASLPYFIPMPLPPLGTMGAVILQGRGVATRRQMFDIAVWGPLAGLIVTVPVLWLGLQLSNYKPIPVGPVPEFADPPMLRWMSHLILGSAPAGKELFLHPTAFAGWVGILITAMNLLPVGQLDGGHILYTLIGRKAHAVALLVLATGFAMMIWRQDFTFSLLLLLLLLTGPRHPPTANDREPLGWPRHVLGWATLAFLLIGFSPQPIAIRDEPARPAQPSQSRQLPDEFVAL